MNRKHPIARRVLRDLTSEEQRRLRAARADAEASREAILAEGRVRKAAWLATRREVTRAVAALKSQRLRLGLSLTDIKSRCGLKPSALSRLENDPDANPTLLTLQRYATALGMTLTTSLLDDTREPGSARCMDDVDGKEP